MPEVTFIGFGEAGAAFARSGDRAFDVKTAMPGEAAAKWREYERWGVKGCSSIAQALEAATVVVSVVTADVALAAAEGAASLLPERALWLDLNSVAPGTKKAAAAAIDAAGGRFVDVAVMAPVRQGARDIPLLVAGPHRDAGAEALRTRGFTNVEFAGEDVGSASAVKMIRSVMVKGIEALTAECFLAAHRAGMTDAVLASLDASPPAPLWSDRADYNLDRMLIHGARRAAEMEEVATTLAEMGVEPMMVRAAIVRQRELGLHGIAPPTGLAAKLAAIDINKGMPAK